MKRFFTYIIIITQLFSLFIGTILAVVFFNSFNLNFYENFYKKENLSSIIGTSFDELIKNTENLLNYLNGKTSLNTSWFSKKDILHMIDVKNLYDVSFNIMIGCFVIFILTSIIIIFLNKKNSLYLISKTFNKVLLTFILTVAVLAGIISYNFNAFWIKFHTTLFSNDLWLLSPDESNLIKMVPEEFFISLITTIIIHILVIFCVLFIVNSIVRKKIKLN